MINWKERLKKILPLCTEEEWDARKYGVPTVTAQLRLAISSLKQQRPSFWTDLAKAEQLIRRPRNSGVRKILQEYSDTQIAFAIRAARM
jgi:hypothetical protein